MTVGNLTAMRAFQAIVYSQRAQAQAIVARAVLTSTSPWSNCPPISGPVEKVFWNQEQFNSIALSMGQPAEMLLHKILSK